jgi:hypothetical protein
MRRNGLGFHEVAYDLVGRDGEWQMGGGCIVINCLVPSEYGDGWHFYRSVSTDNRTRSNLESIVYRGWVPFGAYISVATPGTPSFVDKWTRVGREVASSINSEGIHSASLAAKHLMNLWPLLSLSDPSMIFAGIRGWTTPAPYMPLLELAAEEGP